MGYWQSLKKYHTYGPRYLVHFLYRGPQNIPQNDIDTGMAFFFPSPLRYHRAIVLRGVKFPKQSKTGVALHTFGVQARFIYQASSSLLIYGRPAGKLT